METWGTVEENGLNNTFEKKQQKVVVGGGTKSLRRSESLLMEFVDGHVMYLKYGTIGEGLAQSLMSVQKGLEDTTLWSSGVGDGG